MTNVYAVHSMGRCGTRTIAHSLFGQGYAAVHTHNFSEPTNPYEATTKYILQSYRTFDNDLWVICPVRDPVARNLSVYWHLNERPTLRGFYAYPYVAPEQWFRREMAGYWGVPVLQETFNKRRGWSIYWSPRPRTKVVIIQLEKLMDVWPAVWAEMGNRNNAPELVRVGESHAPEYNRNKLTKAYLDGVYNGEVAKTFYLKKDLERFREQH